MFGFAEDGVRGYVVLCAFYDLIPVPLISGAAWGRKPLLSTASPATPGARTQVGGA